MKNVYIFYAKRTPIGKFAGMLSHVRVDDLLAELFKDFKQFSSFDLSHIDDCLIGCANQAGEDNRNIARMSLLIADFPYSIPASTINRLCGSGLDSLMLSYAKIKSGMADCMLAGGAESMSRAPYVMNKAETSCDRSQKMWDTSLGWRFPNRNLEKHYPLLQMGETAEEVAVKYKVTRKEQDQFAFNSHIKALNAIKESLFSKEIVPIQVQLKKEARLISQDEGPRSDTNLEKLSSLRPVFKSGGTVTAGNSSSINDGASLLGVCSEDFLKKHKLTPLARITDGTVIGVHPNTMGEGPIFAVKKLLAQTKSKIEDFQHVELNEAFAAQAVACQKELKIDDEMINPLGGAIALGHPLGCSGARILTTAIHQMNRDKSIKNALASMCIGLGQGIALSIARAN